HARQQGQDQAADETQWHHQQREQHGVQKPRPHDRPRGNDDLRVEEGLDHRFHANRVSMKRAATTTGRNSTRYAAAPIISGEGLYEFDIAELAWPRISVTATTVPSAVPLVMAMVRLVSGGMVRRSACGSTTCSRVWPKESPVERAASHCPFATEVIPAQKISSEKAISTRPSASHVDTNPDGETSMLGRPK